MLRRLLTSLFLLSLLFPLFALEIMFEIYESGTDIWILLPYEAIHFARDDNSAEYQLSLQIKDSHGKQVVAEETQLIIPKRDWLQGSAIPIKKSYRLSTGSHSLNLGLRNRKLGDNQNFRKSFSVGSQATELGQAYVIAEREGFSYVPDHLFINGLDSLRLVHSFAIGASSLRLKLDDEIFVYENPESPFEIDILELATADSVDTLILSLDEMNIRYQIEPLLYKPWFSYNLHYSLKDQLEQLRYISNQNQWRVLRKIPDSKLAEAIENFWQANDPSPGTLRNEYREFFYQRVIYADEQFTIHSRLKGWRSDRGRIYIKFGEPDQIVSDPFPIGRPPSIIWHYFRLKRNFIFTDEKGFGQYRLRNKDEEYIEY